MRASGKAAPAYRSDSFGQARSAQQQQLAGHHFLFEVSERLLVFRAGVPPRKAVQLF